LADDVVGDLELTKNLKEGTYVDIIAQISEKIFVPTPLSQLRSHKLTL